MQGTCINSREDGGESGISCLGVNSLVGLHFSVGVQGRVVVGGGEELHEEGHLIRGTGCGNGWPCAWFGPWNKTIKELPSMPDFCLVPTSRDQPFVFHAEG